MRETIPAPRSADPAATPRTTRQAEAGTPQRTRWGLAEPSVSAPTMMPIAVPRPLRNHPAASFIPGGYTPASAAPVARRSTTPIVALGANATPTVAAAATTALPAISRRADQR